MSDVGGLAGVLVYTTRDRFDAMRRFYVELLGLSPRSDRPGFVNFDWDGVRLTITVHSELAGVARDPLRVMLNFAAADIEQAFSRLAEVGVRVVRPPEAEPWGGRVATLADPDGNLVQLLELG